MSCDQDQSQATRDNTWAYVRYTRSDGVSEQAIAQVQYFVRARCEHEGFSTFNMDLMSEADIELPLDADGNLMHVTALRFAMCKLWLADVCCEGTIGCRIEADPDTGELPDLFKVRDLSESKTNVRKPRDGAGVRACYFGLWLVNLCEIQSQLVPTCEVVEGGKCVRYFMTAHKASGR